VAFDAPGARRDEAPTGDARRGDRELRGRSACRPTASAATCPDGLQLVTRAPDGPQGWGIGPTDKIRVYVLDLRGGDTVTIVVDAPSGASDSPSGGSDFQDLMDQTVPVVESFNFHE
jgi:hypothetical protein